LKWRQNPKAIEELTAKQTAILQSAARLLKPGGRLVYATCSILREENEAIAEAFSLANPGFTLVEAGPILTQMGVEHAATLVRGPYLRLWPYLHQTDGFFAAVWQKEL
jgi:16S rRNA (cytosine967-C5)-methyltransferase